MYNESTKELINTIKNNNRFIIVIAIHRQMNK
jgi:hypothetical protein